MISEGLRKHAFWLYGVIIGLAIKDALEIVIGHLMVPPNGSMRDAVPETMRLLVFLLTAIQFYLGSVWFFDKFYDAPQPLPLNPDDNSVSRSRNTNYAIDFLFGLFHFLIFFGWAISIDTHQGHLHIFPVLLLVILLYDGLWCWACKGRVTYNEIRKWAFVNLGVVITVIAVYSATYLILILVDIQTGNGDPMRHRIAEAVAMIPVLIVAGVDVIGMITDRQIIADWVVARFRG